MNKTFVICAAALVASLSGRAALPHDITLWPEQDGKAVRLKMYFGDPGDYQPIDKVRFVELAVFDSKDVRISFVHDIERGADNKVLTTPALRLGDWPTGTYVAESRYDNGFYIHDGENRAVATTRDWFPGSIDSAHYQKFSKALFHIGPSSGGFDRVIGHRLELVPRADPFTAKDGSLLPVEVRFDGVVLKDHSVEVGDETAASKGPELQTDAHGIVMVKLDRKGFYRMAVDHRAASKYPELFSFDDYTASLVFSR
jgi:nickel transport protein